MSIPKIIFQHWDEDIPPSMKDAMDSLKKANPEFEHRFYTKEQCRSFIEANFDSDVLYAYDSLVPDAYKCDLWRYCVLYIYGGVYLDVKYMPVNSFKFIDYIDREHFTKDRPAFFKNNFGVLNALMICKPGNQTLLSCIRKVVENVKGRVYGINALYPTGPGVITEFVSPAYDFGFDALTLDCIQYKGATVLEIYKDYRLEQQMFGSPHYGILWNARSIYLAV